MCSCLENNVTVTTWTYLRKHKGWGLSRVLETQLGKECKTEREEGLAVPKRMDLCWFVVFNYKGQGCL